MKKRILLISIALFLLVPLFSMAQNNGYEWKTVEEHLSKQHYNKAYECAESLYNKAIHEGNSHQSLVAAHYLSLIGSVYKEDYIDSSIMRYKDLLPRLNEADQAVCCIYLANIYSSIYQSRRYFIDRNQPSDVDTLNYTLWDASRYRSTVEYYLRQALKNRDVLQTIDPASIPDIVEIQKDMSDYWGDYLDSTIVVNMNLTPSLYDVIVKQVYNIFSSMRYERLNISQLTQPDLLLSIAEQFSTSPLTNVNVDGSMAAFMLSELQNLEAFHLKRHSDDAILIELYTCRYEWLNSIVNVSLEQYKENALEKVISHFRQNNSEFVTQLCYKLAEYYYFDSMYVDAVRVVDSAIAWHPNSVGAKECENIKTAITRKSIEMKVSTVSPADRDILAIVEYKNIDRIYFRIIKYTEFKNNYDLVAYREFLSKQKPLKQWSMSLPDSGDYMQRNIYALLPSMPQGKYMLLASSAPDFNTSDFSVCTYKVQSVIVLPAKESNSIQSGFIVDRITGKPVKHQEVTLYYTLGYTRKYTALMTLKTDADGYYDFTPALRTIPRNKYLSGIKLSLVYNGEKIEVSSVFADFEEIEPLKKKTSCRTFLDRPVYRPGDTVYFASTLFYTYGTREAQTINGMDINVKLLDINDEIADSLNLVTDEYGVVSGNFVLPVNAMPGNWEIVFSGDGKNLNSEYVKVEAYKQPKFTVKLSGPNEKRDFGKPAHVEGMAVSYSAVPISNAHVEYTITRENEIFYRPWSRGFVYPQPSRKVVAEGEVITDGQGMFNIEFVPMPDSNENLRYYTARYVVGVKVTDLNGETHSDNISLRVSYINSKININYSPDGTLHVSHTNLDGMRLNGVAHVEISKLIQPQKPLLEYDIMTGQNIIMPMSRSEFESHFPMFDYDGSANDVSRWQVSKQMRQFDAILTTDSSYSIDISGYGPGVYMVTASMVGVDGDTISTKKYVTYVDETLRTPLTCDLIVTSMEKTTVEVGGVARLRVGSRYDNVTLYVTVNKVSDENIIETHQIHKVSNGFINIDIPVTEQMQGGFNVSIAAIKENHFEYADFDVTVPFPEKNLDVTLVTFRDKLQPGTKEQWTLRIRNAKTGSGALANLTMTMYDHALDNYGGLYYSIWGLWNNSYPNGTFGNVFTLSRSSNLFDPVMPTYFYVYNFIQYVLKSDEDIYVVDEPLSGRRYKSRGVRGFLDSDAPMVELGAVYEERANAIVASVAGVGYDDIAVVEEAVQMLRTEEAEQIVLEETESEEPYIRRNLNTLAFFRPTLRSNTDGIVELSFTAPDLLTEWSIRGIAWTRNMELGRLSASVITQKQLMVVPNVPRFLRQGDICDFSVKVSNVGTSNQNVDIALQITDAVSGKILDVIEGDSVKHLVMNAGANSEVSFRLVIPQQDVYACIYKIVARGQGCSDGEQDVIPVLPNRQLVTESMAMYINGAGEKRYTLSHLANLDTTAPGFSLRHHALTVDLTPNPIWLALQSLPYVSQQENPSNIYLANAIYANSLSAKVVAENPQIERMFRVWEKLEPDAFLSALERNTDLSQTVAAETPWLRDAKSEEQRHRDIARFFNAKTLGRQLSEDIAKLLEAQRDDGGWSWIAGGRYSSLYTTQYILKTFGLLQQQGVELDANVHRALDNAMDYVDRETYTYYQRYIKGRGYDVVNLDYLYVRSYYPDNKLTKRQKEAYDFFYNNAKKHNEEYRTLFSQALLSTVFFRQGDVRLAKEMSVRIREKALYNDEMGMYWRDNVSGYLWSQRPIETQAMLIRNFAEVLGDYESVALMQQWLLKQKQTTNWNTDVSTINAIQSLLIAPESNTGSPIRMTPSQLSVSYGHHTLATDTSRYALHVSQRLESNEITPEDGNIVIRKADDGIAWGALYWQYFERVDKIPASNMGVTLKRTMFRVNTDGTLSAINKNTTLRVGEKVRVRVEIKCDRNLEYLELKDPRCAAMEPVSTASGWRWNNGLSYYCSVTNTAQTLYIDRLDKGTYYVEYDLYVNNAGQYTTAPITMQCLYAPEFRALCPVPELKVLK